MPEIILIKNPSPIPSQWLKTGEPLVSKIAMYLRDTYPNNYQRGSIIRS